MKALRDLLGQLEQSQWHSAEELQAMQMQRFAHLARHAWQHSPFYRLRFKEVGLDGSEPWTRERHTRIPLLTRTELMLQQEHILCHALPPGHGRTYRTQTSGSTGQTVTVLRTDTTQLFWLACTMRDHLWQRRDFTATLAIIKATTPTLDDPAQDARQGWGPPASLLTKTGPSFTQPLSMPVLQQAAWLARIAPHTLLTYPTNFASLLDLHERNEARLPPTLREVRTVGETLHPVYGHPPFCKQLVLMVLGATASVYPASCWVASYPSHDGIRA